MNITPGAPKAPIDELVMDSILIHFSGQYVEIEMRAQAAGTQVGGTLKYTIADDKAQAVRIVDGDARVVERDNIKGVYSRLKDVSPSADAKDHVEAILLAEGVAPGTAKADEKDQEYESRVSESVAIEAGGAK